jgi:hypothetical protein
MAACHGLSTRVHGCISVPVCVQIVCSAIGNAPPPDGLVKVLHLMGHASFTNKQTRNKMCKLFDSDGKHRMLNRRNWCEVRAGPV